MPDYTDEDNHSYNGVSGKSEEDPVKVNDGNYLGENNALWLSSKAANLPGSCASAVNVIHESGGGFACWLKIETGTEEALVDPTAENLDNIFSPTFDSDGLLRRVINIRGWITQVANEAAASLCLAGGANDYTVFGTGTGSTPDIDKGFYSNGGDNGAGNYRLVDTSAGNYTLNFYCDSGDNDILKVGYTDLSAAKDWAAIFVIIDFEPTMKG